MVMKAMRDGASGGILKFILFGFLVMAVGGLVFMDIGGFFRGGGVSNNNVAQVGPQAISIIQFDRELRGVLSRIGMTPQEAYERGYVNQFLTEQIRNVIVEQYARDLGIVVSEEKAAETIKKAIAPGIEQGRSPEEVLQQILLSQNMNEAQFVHSIQTQMETQPLIQTLQASGAVVSEAMLKDLIAYQGMKRDVKYLFFADKQAPSVSEPTSDELMDAYTSTQEQYAIPESRVFQVIEIVHKGAEGASEDEILEEQYALADLVDDLAAGGTPPEEIATEVGGKITTLPAVDLYGTIAKLDSYEEVKPDILEAGFALEDEGEVSPVVEARDGRFLAVALKTLTPKSYRPFEDVEGELKERWMESQRRVANKTMTDGLALQVNEGQITLEDLARGQDQSVKTISNIVRSGNLEKPLSSGNIPAIFGVKVGQAVSLPADGGFAILVVSDVHWGDEVAEDDEVYKQAEASLKQSTQNETIGFFLNKKRRAVNIKVNERLLKTVYGPQPDDF